jgi:AcrR family transcriptional regulator
MGALQTGKVLIMRIENEASLRDKHRDKRAQILIAAADLIRDHGIQAVSFERIAKQAGLSRQLLRYYFSDQDEIIVELCDFLASRYRELLVSGIVKIGQVQRLKFFLDFFFDLAEGHPMPDDLEVYDSLVAYAVGSDRMKERLCGQYLTLGQVVVHELAIAHPTLSGKQCEELSFLFVSMMHAHWSFVATLGYSRDHSQLTRRAIDRLIESYIKDAPPVLSLDTPWARDR